VAPDADRWQRVALPAGVLVDRAAGHGQQLGDLSGGEQRLAELYEGRRHRRWPDLVIDYGDPRRAIELELTVKHTPRLRAIIDAYQLVGAFDEVLWLVEQPGLRRRVEEMISNKLSMSWVVRDLIAPVAMRVDSYAPPVL
jgi:hypothetical protein